MICAADVVVWRIKNLHHLQAAALPQIGLRYALANFRPHRVQPCSAFRVDFIFRPCVASKGSWQSHILGVFLFPSEKNQGLFHI